MQLGYDSLNYRPPQYGTWVRTFALLILFSLTTSVVGQEQSEQCRFFIEGQVFDIVSEEPIPLVTIQLEGSALGTVSDESGMFYLGNLCSEEYELQFSILGYKVLKHHHDFHHGAMKIFLAEDHLLLEGITVEAEHQHADMGSIASSELDERALALLKNRSLGEALSSMAGVGSISTGQNVVKPVIHGLHSNRILVINGGLRHEFQNWGIDHAPEIDPALLEEIEVIKGAATVRFGPDALGGVIVVEPQKAEIGKKLSGMLESGFASNGRSLTSTLDISKGFKRWGISAGGSWTRQGDLKAPDYMLTNTGLREKSARLEALFHWNSKMDLRISGSHLEQSLGILSGSVFSTLGDLESALESDIPQGTNAFSYDLSEPKQETRHSTAKALWSYIGEQQSLRLQYGFQTNMRQEFGVRRIEAPNIDLELESHSMDLDWHHPKVGFLEGKLGAQWLSQVNRNNPGTNTVPFVPNYRQERLGVYLIESYEWNHSAIEFGLRYDILESDVTGREPDNTIYRNTVRYQNLSGTLGAKLELAEGTIFRSNLGTAWRAPNIAELYRFGQHSFFLEYGLWRYTVDERFDFIVTTEGILDESDRAVPAEQGYKWINGLTIEKNNFGLEFSAYVNYVQNFINSRPAGFTRTPRGVFIFYINDQADALFWGGDLSARWRHNEVWESQLSASYLWAKQIERDDYFVGLPPADLRYTSVLSPSISWLDGFEARISCSYTFEQTQHPRIISAQEFLEAFRTDLQRFGNDAKDFDLIPPPSGYILLSASMSATYRQWQLHLIASNILNTRYRSYTDRLRYFADAMGSNLEIRLGWKF
ncbi:MAG: TonB-dependent receptor [Saprospiraceae bacterium]|nr:TonB-dependent receptor [Saprospiraceae bacterium]